MNSIVAYYRVSTAKQEESGLGLLGQQAAVAAYATAGGRTIVAAFTEVETGKIADRPELAKALAHARRTGATLCIAKLDRLARNVAFVANLMEAGVDFVACDNPHCGRLTIHILAAVAEDEARRISERTKAALTAFKAEKRIPRRIREMYPDGVPADVAEATAGKLGANRIGCRLTDAGRAKGQAKGHNTRRKEAIAAVADLAPEIVAWRSEGLTLQAIADRLNSRGATTARNAAWGPVQVQRTLARAAQ